MDAEERFRIATRNTVEVVTEEELRKLLSEVEHPKAYLGFEPSGLFHIGWLVWAYKVADLVEIGVDFTLLAATWHAWINDKLGGDLELIHRAAEHVVSVLEALGIPRTRVRVVKAEDLVSRVRYWEKILRIAKSVSLSRVKRALTIMGRRADEAELDFSKLIYPLMQVADIFELGVDIALGGMDQRKAHMLARDVAEKLGFKKPVAIHTPLIPSLTGGSRMDMSRASDEELAEVKMSKSKPETAIFVVDSDEEIRRKIRKAYCPPREVEGNPIMAIAKHIIFARGPRRFVIERKPKYGGTIEVESYEELERIYVEGKLHPLDLKNAVAEELIKIVKPVREKLLQDPSSRQVLELIARKVTR
ncbi:MAG: tyrosine--tRNA ligase [Crenarchaeota archaeon]|nr:tyrosine--tRNA ligase [Thermoproteota archaeon]